MRIEKINDRQIRCTLNQKDLQDREIGISELAYGTAKAKALFRDMMQQASYEFGFDADDIPLMIEAIPLLPEALILVITKVEEPDELDTRFSTFTEEGDWEMTEEGCVYDDYDDYADEEEDEFIYMGAKEEVLDPEKLWGSTNSDVTTDNVREMPISSSAKQENDFISLPEALGMEPRPKQDSEKNYRDVVVIFSFPNLDAVSQLAEHIHPFYCGENTLYKDDSKGVFYLLLHRSKHPAEEFGRICNILHEYGSPVKNSAMTQFYLQEHYQKFIARNAISVLAKL